MLLGPWEIQSFSLKKALGEVKGGEGFGLGDSPGPGPGLGGLEGKG